MNHHEVLGGEDTAWLHMEDATNPMVVTAMLELGAPIAPASLAGILTEHFGKIPRFRQRVVEPRIGAPRWEDDPAFDVSRHVEHVELPAGDAALRAFVGRAASELLDRDLPLWRVYLLDRRGAGSTILARVHHAIADGFALLRVLLSLCDADPLPYIPAPRTDKPHGLLDDALALERVTALPPDPPTALRGALTNEKVVAWTEAVPLDDVKAIARAASATVNDVLVTTIAGALRRYLASRGDAIDGLEIHAMVPVNLRRSAPPLALGNRFGLVVLGLPIGLADPAARLNAVKRGMDEIKATPEAAMAYALLSAMGRAPKKVEDRGVTFFGKKASLVLTNVPGPRERLAIAGRPIEKLVFWAPQSGRMGLGISILSYAGEITIGLLADRALVPDPEALAADVHVELAALGARVRAERRADAHP